MNKIYPAIAIYGAVGGVIESYYSIGPVAYWIAISTVLIVFSIVVVTEEIYRDFRSK